MNSSPWRKALLGAVATLSFALGHGSDARAQVGGAPTITVAPQVFRVNPDGSVAAQRPQQFRPEGFNYQDCVGDIRIRLNVTMGSATQNANPVAWAGTNCADRDARQGVSPTCWPAVASTDDGEGGAATGQIKREPLGQDILIRVQDLVEGQNRVSARGGGAAEQGLIGYPNGTAASCERQATPGEVNIPIWFMWLDQNGEVFGQANQSFSAAIDVRGPPAPTLGAPSVGQVLTIPIRVPQGVTDAQQYVAYCNPPPGESLPVDSENGPVSPGPAAPPRDGGGSGTDRPWFPDLTSRDGGPEEDASLGDAGEDATTDGGDAASPGNGVDATVPDPGGGEAPAPPVPADVSCNASPFLNADGSVRTRAEERFRCGEVGGAAAQSITVRRLSPGTTYAVTVAGIDQFGNVGPLAEPICASPTDTDDFWERYKRAGGNAGGQCALEAVGLPVESSLALFASGALAVGWLRRRRRS